VSVGNGERRSEYAGIQRISVNGSSTLNNTPRREYNDQVLNERKECARQLVGWLGSDYNWNPPVERWIISTRSSQLENGNNEHFRATRLGDRCMQCIITQLSVVACSSRCR
jgi:hypothetical protein